MKQKILALLLAAALCLTLLAACASNNKTSGEETTPPAGNSGEETAPPADTGDEETAPPADTGDEETAPPADEEEEDTAIIEFYLVTNNTLDQDPVEDVEDAINAITVPAINVEVNMHTFDMGSYATSLSLAVTGGETVDLCSLYGSNASYASYLANGQLMDISGMLEQYGQELLDTVGVFIDAYRSNGGIYGVPTYRNYVSSVYLYMRKDILDQLGISEDEIHGYTTFSEIENLFQTVKDNTDVYPLGSARTALWMQTDCIGWYDDDFSKYDDYDYLGDSLFAVHADMDGVVTSVYDSESFQWVCKKTADWDAAGYIWPDTVVTTDQPDNVIKQGVAFGQIYSSEYGIEIQKQQSTGYEIAALNMGDDTLKTGVITRFGCGVPVTAEEPEAAVKFLNLLYSSEELMNLLDWGLEGRDYVMLDSGEAGYPDGSDGTVPYHVSDFIFGNFFLVAPWDGNGSDYRDVVKGILDAADASPYLGFQMNTSELADAIASINSVKEEYYYALTCGMYTDDLYNEFLDKLDAAGLDGYLAEAQSQLDAWMAQ